MGLIFIFFTVFLAFLCVSETEVSSYASIPFSFSYLSFNHSEQSRPFDMIPYHRRGLARMRGITHSMLGKDEA